MKKIILIPESADLQHGYVTKYQLSLVTPKNVAIGVGTITAGYIIYKIVVGIATWECFGCGILLMP